MKRLIITFVAASAVGGCSHHMNNLKKRAAFDLNCPAESLKTQQIGTAWAVEGCQERATYVQGANGVWVLNTTSVSAQPKGTRQGSGGSAGRAQTGTVARKRHVDGYTILSAASKLPPLPFKVRIVGAPTRDADQVLFAIGQATSAPRLKTCELKFVVDGGRMELPVPTYSYEHHKEELRLALPLAQLAELARAERVVGDVCGARFELTDAEFAIYREFLTLFQEELALSGGASDKETPVPTGEGML